MKTTYHIKIKSNGDLEFLPLPPPGLVVTELKSLRFSEIVPVSPARRCAFRLLRCLFGEAEDGMVANWTRRWRCLWECRILRGPYTGATNRMFSRLALVDWEHRVWRNYTPNGTEKDLNSETKTKT